MVAVELPGMESRDADRSAITVDDHVAAVVAAIDAAEGPVILVGHSAGSGIASAAVDARPDRVARAIYVGGFPSPDGDVLINGFDAVNGEIPLPDFSEFSDEDLGDLDEAALAAFRERSIPSPEQVVHGTIHLHDDRRYARAGHGDLPGVHRGRPAGVDRRRRGFGAGVRPHRRRHVRRPADRALAAVHEAGGARGAHPRAAAAERPRASRPR